MQGCSRPAFHDNLRPELRKVELARVSVTLMECGRNRSHFDKLAEQSLWDCGLSYLLSYSTKLYDQFKSW